ncbi:MAG TPA: hypothetical protein VMU49_08585 [Candidatus Acidoferrales bacterium]|nr:hypothetical protein [Candidatus Acidoferrales bacterium]
MTLAEVRIRRAPVLVVGAVVTFWLVLLYLTRHFSFYYDEWDFVRRVHTWAFRDYLVPHSEHWSTLPKLWYTALLTLNGGHSYAPFMAGVLAAHGAVVVLIFLLVRQRAGDLLALGAAAAMLVLGNGFENLLWGFQIGFDASVAFGLLAALLLESPDASWKRRGLAAAALLCSLMCSGVGLFWYAALFVDLLVEPARRRRLDALVLPGLAYVIWFLWFGRAPVASHPLSLQTLVSVGPFVAFGLGSAAAGLLGPSQRWGELALAGWSMALGAHLANLDWRFGRRVLGPLAGVFTQFVLTGLVRGELGTAEAGASRYVYVAAPFLLLIASEMLARAQPRSAWGLMAAVLLTVSVILNVHELGKQIEAKNAFFSVQSTELRFTWLVRDAPSFAPAAVIDPAINPSLTAERYVAVRTRWGSDLKPLSKTQLMGLPAVPLASAADAVLPTRVTTSADSTKRRSECQSTVPGGANVTLPDGGTAAIYASQGTVADVRVSPVGNDVGPTVATVTIAPGSQALVSLPNSGLGLLWHLNVSAPSYAPAQVCR